jgi:hypothetical protein
VKELVLPSGRFAQIRDLTWWDRVLTAHTNPEVYIIAMAVRVTTIDGEPLTLQMAGDMTLDEANPIIELIAGQLADSLKSKGVS